MISSVDVEAHLIKVERHRHQTFYPEAAKGAVGEKWVGDRLANARVSWVLLEEEGALQAW